MGPSVPVLWGYWGSLLPHELFRSVICMPQPRPHLLQEVFLDYLCPLCVIWTFSNSYQAESSSFYWAPTKTSPYSWVSHVDNKWYDGEGWWSKAELRQLQQGPSWEAQSKGGGHCWQGRVWGSSWKLTPSQQRGKWRLPRGRDCISRLGRPDLVAGESWRLTIITCVPGALAVSLTLRPGLETAQYLT